MVSMALTIPALMATILSTALGVWMVDCRPMPAPAPTMPRMVTRIMASMSEKARDAPPPRAETREGTGLDLRVITHSSVDDRIASLGHGQGSGFGSVGEGNDCRVV